MHTSMFTEGAAPTTVNPTRFTPGDIVGPWRIERELGRGGMSTVYAVVHTEIGKRAALKVVYGHVLTTTFTAERVLLEAQVVNRIGHSHIVDIFESGTLADGRPYLVMERLDGVTLGHRFAQGRIPADQVVGFLLQICDALVAAHAAGVVHRDLKLDNVFLVDGPAGPQTFAKVLDWGIAKVVTHDNPRNTFADKLIGTPQYVSPEQARGGDITPAADIYSLGVMAYEMFLEVLPFVSGSAAELLVMHLRDQPPAPHDAWPGIPPALEALLLAMLAKAPSDRPTASEVAAQLAAIGAELAGHTIAGSISVNAPRMIAPALQLPSIPPVPSMMWRAIPTPVPTRVPAIDVRTSLVSRQVRRPRFQRQRVLFAAFASVVLLAGAGAMEALLAADDALGAEPAEAAAATRTEPVVPVTSVVVAPAAAIAPATPGAVIASAAKPKPVARRPAIKKPRRQDKPEDHKLSVLDPDGTIEPYQ